jgi:glutamate synthase domain-containing protein 1/glutamate synthase domain-containing protein 3
MDRERLVERVVASRRTLDAAPESAARKAAAEGGCGVIGMAASVPVAGRHLLRSLEQMRNRGNGKGGGVAAVGLDPDFFGVDERILRNDYLIAVALLDSGSRRAVEADFIHPTFVVDYVWTVPSLPDFHAVPGLEVAPPEVVCYFVRVRPDVREAFMRQHGLSKDEADAAGLVGGHEASVGSPRASGGGPGGSGGAGWVGGQAAPPEAVDDEIVYQNSYRLNRALYASTGEKRAFVLSHAKDLLVLKLVGYGDDVVRYYRLEDLTAHVWIGHHRYPTKGRVWHPGGAHPFIGMHEALVHNGDFANYASIASYLAQRHIHPLFLTDTEVAVLMFDLLHRTYGYPLEAVIEAMAPTTERDFTLLPPDKQGLYRMLQAVHVHGSPDGPWFFLIAQADPRAAAYRLVGITDTSMLRPQVFALQHGEEAIGLAASEKQGIDAALASLAAEDPRFWTRADLYWNARGGSHTDGGAFIFSVEPGEGRRRNLVCTDKFGHVIAPHPDKLAPSATWGAHPVRAASSGRGSDAGTERTANDLFAHACAEIADWRYDDVRGFLAGVEGLASDAVGMRTALDTLTLLLDRRVPTGRLKRSLVCSLADESLARLFARVRDGRPEGFAWHGSGPAPQTPAAVDTVLLLDARGFPAEGPDSLARTIVEAFGSGWRRFVVAHAGGHRFIGCGLGPTTSGVRIDVYGSAGDYLASGIDGAEVIVHGSGQDQLAQVMKDGTLVVHGDVGQTFGYAAKGGRAFVLGNAAGRPLINAVGRPQIVINGTCLDYLAESFMAGDPLNGGGFVILNGVTFDEDGVLVALPTPYPGGNLFSLASGGAIYLRDPHGAVGEDQLNGGAFADVTAADWALIEERLRDNERLFGIRVEQLLTVDGQTRGPEHVYRKIRPARHEALQPEEAWVRKAG